MAGIKLGFSFVDYARHNGMGLGSVRLKDGSSMKILTSLEDKTIQLFKVHKGRLLEAKGYKGANFNNEAGFYGNYVKALAENPKEAECAFDSSFDVIM